MIYVTLVFCEYCETECNDIGDIRAVFNFLLNATETVLTIVPNVFLIDLLWTRGHT